MTIWLVGGLVLLVATSAALFPILRGKSAWQPLALALVFAGSAGGLYLYQHVGTPAAIGIHAAVPENPQQAGDMDQMVDQLRSKLTENPEDLEGWMLLARSLKAMQRFEEAETALETAFRIDGDNPTVLVELAETRIFTSADGRISEDGKLMLERALQLDPGHQKGLFLMGIAAAQAGDDAFAISYWEELKGQLEPGSSIATSVQQQIDEAKSRMGMLPDSAPDPHAGLEMDSLAPGAQDTDSSAEPLAADGIRLQINAVPGINMPESAVLWIMVRAAGATSGAPLGVRRIMNPGFPLQLTLTDADSMLQEMKISSLPEVSVQARISMSGSPGARPGDWQSAAVNHLQGDPATVELEINQQVE